MAAIIFDFDGTISDSFDYVVDFLAAEAGVQLDDNQKKALRGRSMFAIARRLGHPWWRLPGLFWRGRRLMGKSIRRVRPFAGIPGVIEKLHAEGHELFIISSNNVTNIRAFLHEHKLHTYFLEIYGGVIFNKAAALKRLLKEQQLEPGSAIYIGDERRDVRAAEAAKLRAVAVTWGFSRPADLKAHHPLALVHKPAELLSVLEEL